MGSGGTLEIGGSAAPLSAFMSGLVVSGLVAGDTIDLTNVSFVSGATASAANGFLDVTVGGTSYALGLGTPNTFPGVQFLVSGDGVTGTDVTLSAPVIVSKVNSPYKVSSGHTDTGDIVVSGGSMFVLSGGTADSTTVSSGGFLTISHGGTDSGTTLAGKETVLGLDIGAAVQSGGTLAIHSGGTADPATISSGGIEIVSAHGTDFGAQVDGGGVQIVSSGGSAISATLAGGTTNSLAIQIVSFGGKVFNTGILSGGGLAVSRGGLAVSTIINSVAQLMAEWAFSAAPPAGLPSTAAAKRASSRAASTSGPQSAPADYFSSTQVGSGGRPP